MIRKVQRRGERRLLIDIRYTRRDGTRARLRKDADVQTMAAATAEERRILACIAQHGEPHEPRQEPETAVASITFGVLVTRWHETTAHTLKPTTRIGYTEILDTRLLPALRQLPVASIGFDHAAELDAAVTRDGCSASRRRNVQIVLRSLLGYAVDAGHLTDQPKLPPLPKVGKVVVTTLSIAVVAHIIASASPAARVALALAVYAGLRSGEIRALRWCDVDLAAGLLVVRLSHSKGVTSTPKSGHERKVPIAGPLRTILTAIPGPHHAGDLVAPNGDDDQWGDTGILQALRRAMARAGVGGGPRGGGGGQWRVHDLRHAFVTGLLRAGANPKAVQALAGHHSLTVTERYAHLEESDLCGAIAVLDVGATLDVGPVRSPRPGLVHLPSKPATGIGDHEGHADHHAAQEGHSGATGAHDD